VPRKRERKSSPTQARTGGNAERSDKVASDQEAAPPRQRARADIASDDDDEGESEEEEGTAVGAADGDDEAAAGGEDEAVHVIDEDVNPPFVMPARVWDDLLEFQRTGLAISALCAHATDRVTGVRWMWELHQQNVGGILGDEMVRRFFASTCGITAAFILG